MKPTPKKWPATARARALAIITRHTGKDGVAAFLRERQPSFDDRRGGEILQNDPQELLRRLVMLDAGHHLDELDERALDAERALNLRKKTDAGRILALLDEIEGGEG